MIVELAVGVGGTVAYAVVGVVLMGLGYGLVDLLTPGKLGELIWHERNPNAALVLLSGLASVGLIVVTAILTSDDAIVRGLLSTVVYGLLGIVLMGAAFLLLDALTPGRLGETLTERALHPAAWVTAVVHLAVAGIIAASVT
ncbi:DUF350 domain-containing protein [Actinomycetospora sp. CA-101289]|uniref:DUF350 domain-containing protein n=1 Tax=Actinomycetospora sp. CA-101289 TaxID=3239893 RepID=UPI003D969CFF